MKHAKHSPACRERFKDIMLDGPVMKERIESRNARKEVNMTSGESEGTTKEGIHLEREKEKAPDLVCVPRVKTRKRTEHACGFEVKHDSNHI